MTSVASSQLELGGEVEADRPRLRTNGDRHAGGLVPTAAVVAAYVAAAVVCFWHVWSNSPSSVSIRGGDQFDFMWFLQWVPFAVTHGHNLLYSSFANWPYGINLVSNTSILFLGLIASPVTLAWGPVVAFNVLNTAALAGSATAGYFFIRRWTSWRPAAFVGGLVYGFGPYQIGQGPNHLNLSFVVLPPLILLVLDEMAVRQRGSPRTWGFLLGLMATAQFFVSTEVLISTGIMAVVCLIAVAGFGHQGIRSHLPFFLRSVGWTIGVAIVFLTYPIWFGLHGLGHINGPIQLVPQGYRTDLLGPIVPTRNFQFAPSSLAHMANSFSANPAENGSYLGITLLVVVVISAVVLWRRSLVIRVSVIAAASAFVLSLGDGLVVTSAPPGSASGFPLPGRLLAAIPELDNMIPVRFSLYVDLFAGLVLGVALTHLHDSLATGHLVPGGLERAHAHRARRRRMHAARATVVPAVVAAVALLPLVPAVPFTGIGSVLPPGYFTSAAVTRIPSGSVALVYPYPSQLTPQPLLWQAEANMRFRMPGGYFLVPQGSRQHIAFSTQLGLAEDTLTAQVFYRLFEGVPPPLTAGLRTELDDELANWDVHTVVAFPKRTPHPVRSLTYLTSLLHARPVIEPGGAYAWYDLRF